MARLSKSKERTERERLRQTDREERKVNKIQGEKKKSRSQGRHPAATHSKNELHKQRASEAGLEV
jgi:hypothetical protein